jgi:AMP deaminase
MEISLQRLGDDPRDYDGNFTGIQQGHADVSGLRADANPFSSEKPLTAEDQGKPEFGRWNIYPSPPPAHWHWQGKTAEGKHIVGEGGEGFDESKRDGATGDVKLVPVDSFKEEKEKNRGTNGSEGFSMRDADVPGLDGRGWRYEVDAEGVYQVYGNDGESLFASGIAS